MATGHPDDTETVEETAAEEAAETRERRAFVDRYPFEAWITRLLFSVSFAAFGLGAVFGLIQALHRTGYARVISSADYYSILTGHGVLMALVFTTFFIAGLFNWGTTRSLGRGTVSKRFTNAWVWLMIVGTVAAAIPILAGLFPSLSMNADVLFTFYAPLKAHPLFYVGAVLLIVGSWGSGLDQFRRYWAWREDNPDSRIPLQTFMVLTTYLMWYIATAGVAIEVLFFLLPWALGLIETVDPLLTRTLFWYFGHPVVYFWLLPAYFVWYTILPKLAGGRLVSDAAARVVFVLFLLLSTPVGFHHQYVDPGIPADFKFVAMVNTMFLLLPSLLTAFTVVASLEHGARQNGAGGRLAWLKSLPWDSPAFAGLSLAGLMFAAGGFSGMINAGMNINYLVHNTIWVPGHFHLTVGTAFALSAMAISYWLVPQLTGRRLQYRGLALAQPYLWFLGMLLMSNAMHRAGLLGVPRRTAEPTYEQFAYGSSVGGIGELQLQIALGGTLLFVAAMLFLVVMIGTWVKGHKNSKLEVNGEIPEPLVGAASSPTVLDNIKLWTLVAILFIALAYGLPIYDFLADGALFPGSPPIKPA